MSYELANLSNRNIFLLSPKIETTLSYFPNLAVSIIIEYLGRN